jgi:hypothetical protein
MVNASEPVLDNVTVCAPLAVPRFCDENVSPAVFTAACPAPVPVPLRVTACGDPGALSVIVKVAVRVPLAVGANRIVILQLALPTKPPLHEFTKAKSLAFAPPRATELIDKIAEDAVLVNVTFCCELAIFTGCDPKERLLGLNDAWGAATVADNATVAGVTLAEVLRLSDPLCTPTVAGEN